MKEWLTVPSNDDTLDKLLLQNGRTNEMEMKKKIYLHNKTTEQNRKK